MRFYKEDLLEIELTGFEEIDKQVALLSSTNKKMAKHKYRSIQYTFSELVISTFISFRKRMLINMMKEVGIYKIQ